MGMHTIPTYEVLDSRNSNKLNSSTDSETKTYEELDNHTIPIYEVFDSGNNNRPISSTNSATKTYQELGKHTIPTYEGLDGGKTNKPIYSELSQDGGRKNYSQQQPRVSSNYAETKDMTDTDDSERQPVHVKVGNGKVFKTPFS